MNIAVCCAMIGKMKGEIDMFGMPSMIELNTVAESVALCKELGLSFLELNTNFPNQQLHLLDPAELKKQAQEAGIFYTIHLNDELYVADFNPHVSQGYRDAVREAIAFAQNVGAPVLNMHLCTGAKYTMPDRKVYFYEAYEAQYLEEITDFRDLCTQFIGDAPIRICVENTSGYLPFQKKALEILLQSPAFGLTLDIGHNCCAGNVDEPWILSHSDRLLHMHLHDVTDGKNDHMPFGTGNIDLPKYLAMAENRTAVLEVKTIAGLRQTIHWLRE